MSDNRERLRMLIQQRCLTTGPEFTLSTGEKSRFYFDCKAITLNGEGLTLIAQECLKTIRSLPVLPTAIGGLTLGADFVTAAVAMLSHQTGGPITDGSIVRKEPKKHGTRNRIENQLPVGTKIVVVDDVITSGASTQKACDEFEAAGYEIVAILAIVDREAGGKQRLESRYPNVRTLFNKRDFPIPAESETNSGVANRAVA